MKYHIDRKKWNKPHYGGHYDERAIEYEGIRCRCEKCKISFVFEPVDQKEQFEVLGRYPFWKPSLCVTCQNEWKNIKQKINQYEIAWQKRELLPADQSDLKDWLNLIQLSSGYRKKDYSSRAKMLRKIIST